MSEGVPCIVMQQHAMHTVRVHGFDNIDREAFREISCIDGP